MCWGWGGVHIPGGQLCGVSGCSRHLMLVLHTPHDSPCQQADASTTGSAACVADIHLAARTWPCPVLHTHTHNVSQPTCSSSSTDLSFSSIRLSCVSTAATTRRWISLSSTCGTVWHAG
jgi:hypothetical protein